MRIQRMSSRFSVLLLVGLFLLAGAVGLMAPTATFAGESATPPALNADITFNMPDNPIEITFEDDQNWRTVISAVYVDDAILEASEYTSDAPGKITIDAVVFTTTKDYDIIIQADGYADASVTQKIEEAALEIKGDGVETPRKYTMSHLQGLGQHQQMYSTINTWPTKKFYVVEGVKLMPLLEEAGVKGDATLIKFTSNDGFNKTLTWEQFTAPRYYYPGLTENHEYFGYIEGSPDGAQQVDAMLALRSAENSTNPAYMTTSSAPLLVLGQQWLTEQTNELFVKYVESIEVTTDPLIKWVNPTATPAEGTVSAGTEVALTNEFNDADKIHYTLDGSDPTIESPMYNWIAKRWWSQRGEETVAEINHPIVLTKDTTIKAVTIGPGHEDSDIVEFTYTVDEPDPIAVIGVSIAESDQELEEGETVQLTAVVAPENATNKAVTWTSRNEAVATVSETGLVTAVAEGTATITITTKDGYFTDSIKVTVSEKTDPFLTAEPSEVKVSSNFDQEFILTVENDTIIRAVDAKDIQLEGVFQGLTIKSVGKTVTDEVYTTTTVTAEVYGILTTPGNGIIALSGMVLANTDNDGWLKVSVTVKDDGTGQQPVDPEDPVILTITGDGVTTPREFTQSQLEAMTQHEEVYSCINTWPTKKWYVGRGVSLRDLLDEAGVSGAQQITFVAVDGYKTTLMYDELLGDTRYCFPNFKEGGGDADGHIPGDSSGAYPVETILGLVSAEGTDNPRYMNNLNAPLLMLGQRAVTEQTGPIYVKNVKTIDVSNDRPEQWDEPWADPEPGMLPAGTEVVLHSEGDDDDKVYYTTDGSDPTMDSPMYNWVARRWWSSRGEETVAEINHPIELTKDTTIKAVTIGPGKRNSSVVEFDYKVTETAVSTSDQIGSEGGTVSLGDEVVLEIPAGALTGSSPVEVTIERVTEPPAAPTGLRLLGGVYEFNVDGSQSYSFAKPVTIKFRFDPGKVRADETPAVHYYDETAKKWVSIGGEVSKDTITVQVDHFTRFGVMVALPTSATVTIDPDEGGTVSLGGEVFLEIPAGALIGASPVEVRIERVAEPPATPTGLRLLGGVYEFSVDGNQSYNFVKPVTIKIGFNRQEAGSDETPAVHYYDQTTGQWVALATTVAQDADGGWYAVTQVDHITKYALFIATAERTIVLKLGQQTATVDGKPYALDAPPFVDTRVGRTLAPLRFIGEALGAEVGWTAETGQILIKDGDNTIALTLGFKHALVNGQTTTMDCAPVTVPPGRTLVPLRFVGEALGAAVDYDATKGQIIITRSADVSGVDDEGDEGDYTGGSEETTQ